MFEIFKAYQFNSKKAKEYGFVENQGVWTYSSTILQGDFLMMVTVEDGDLSFRVYDQETGELYPQVHMESMRGTFVGSIREDLFRSFFMAFERLVLRYRNFSVLRQKRILTRVQEKYENQ